MTRVTTQAGNLWYERAHYQWLHGDKNKQRLSRLVALDSRDQDGERRLATHPAQDN
jgi:hypothetical protein